MIAVAVPIGRDLFSNANACSAGKAAIQLPYVTEYKRGARRVSTNPSLKDEQDCWPRTVLTGNLLTGRS